MDMEVTAAAPKSLADVAFGMSTVCAAILASLDTPRDVAAASCVNKAMAAAARDVWSRVRERHVPPAAPSSKASPDAVLRAYAAAQRQLRRGPAPLLEELTLVVQVVDASGAPIYTAAVKPEAYFVNPTTRRVKLRFGPDGGMPNECPVELPYDAASFDEDCRLRVFIERTAGDGALRVACATEPVPPAAEGYPGGDYDYGGEGPHEMLNGAEWPNYRRMDFDISSYEWQAHDWLREALNAVPAAAGFDSCTLAFSSAQFHGEDDKVAMHCVNYNAYETSAEHPNRVLRTAWFSLVLRLPQEAGSQSRDVVGFLRVGELSWDYREYSDACGWEPHANSQRTLLHMAENLQWHAV